MTDAPHTLAVDVGGTRMRAAIVTADGKLGRGHADVVYLTVSTGIGAGVLVDGRECSPSGPGAGR